jgi:alpha-D-ribose 1-methylphosphonate 5-triphosphate synthase subunit PhnH
MTSLGFADPVFDGQAAFRAALKAMASPGEIVLCGESVRPPAALAPAAAAALLALADLETPLWIAPQFPQGEDIADYLRFHTGAPVVSSPAEAAFALVALSEAPLDLGAFAQGAPEYPDASTTLIAQAERLTQGGALALRGPGVKGEIEFDVSPRPSGFIASLEANHLRFPLGVDILLAAGDKLAALPRSTRARGAV